MSDKKKVVIVIGVVALVYILAMCTGLFLYFSNIF